MKILVITFSLLLMMMVAQAQAAGSLQVNGQPGRFQIFQKVKAVRCNPESRGECDAAVFFALNQAQPLPEGQYLVGFENSLYPGWVEVKAGSGTVLNLEKISIPERIHGSDIRVIRDFTSEVEQNKIFFEMYAMNHHFFRLDKNNFGDFYLTGSWERDSVQRFTYEACAKIKIYTGDVNAQAKSLCNSWNTASNPSALRDFYVFASNGTFKELWVTFPGDIIPTQHERYLVSAPLTDADFVSVFPGVYKVVEGRNAVQIRTANVVENY